MEKNIDYIIVGQGLAGSLLAWLLIKEGKTVQIFDNQHSKSASAIAAGVINPITGRRFVKSWMFDTLLSEAKILYKEIEAELDISIFSERNILRVLFNHKEENEWFGRSGLSDYAPYMDDEARLVEYKKHLKEHFGMGELKNAAQVNLPLLITALKKHFSDQELLNSEKFKFSEVYTNDDGVEYKNFKAKKIIFCEGQQARNNPFFNHLPFVPAKGEVLIVRIPDVDFSKMLKHRIFLVPLQNDLYWVGSSYNWDFLDELPTEVSKLDLSMRLEEAITTPFEIIDHKAAIRPTVKDRRPFLGIHPDFPELAIFNGLGTKGASLAPYWANHLVDFLVNNSPIESEVDIKRFEK